MSEVANNLPDAYEHPHDRVAGVPERLARPIVRELSVLQPRRALAAVALEWLGIGLAVGCCALYPNLLVYLAAVIFIGARQHALAVLGHDASHFRFLPDRKLNDGLGNLLMKWPLLISVGGFRAYHGAHHRYLGEEGDGNRVLWQTHTPDGALAAEWVYPKTRRELVRKLLRHTFAPTGFMSVTHSLLAMFKVGSWRERTAQLSFYVVLAALFTLQGWWLYFILLWLVPLRTWHMTTQYMRLISEHSFVQSDDPAFRETRTTVPTRWESLLILPRNIGYHIEHHWYPSVPFYNLPALHAELMKLPRYREGADVSHSIFSSLGEVTTPDREAATT